MAAVSGKLLPRKIADIPKAYRYVTELIAQVGILGHLWRGFLSTSHMPKMFPEVPYFCCSRQNSLVPCPVQQKLAILLKLQRHFGLYSIS
jgi:hypothetical protein